MAPWNRLVNSERPSGWRAVDKKRVPDGEDPTLVWHREASIHFMLREGGCKPTNVGKIPQTVFISWLKDYKAHRNPWWGVGFTVLMSDMTHSTSRSSWNKHQYDQNNSFKKYWLKHIEHNASVITPALHQDSVAGSFIPSNVMHLWHLWLCSIPNVQHRCDFGAQISGVGFESGISSIRNVWAANNLPIS